MEDNDPFEAGLLLHIIRVVATTGIAARPLATIPTQEELIQVRISVRYVDLQATESKVIASPTPSTAAFRASSTLTTTPRRVPTSDCSAATSPTYSACLEVASGASTLR